MEVERLAPTMENFKCSQDFAVWLDLVSRQFSDVKERLGRIS